MNLKDILSISGEPGLFKFVAQGRNAIIVEHLETKKRRTAPGSAKVSSLEEISVYTDKDDIPLGKIFDLIYAKESGGSAIDSKSDAAKLKTYFEEVLPEYDKNRVYVSDMKKVVLWYNTLQKLGQLVKDEPDSKKDEEKKPESEKISDNKSKTKAPARPKTKPVGKPGSKSASTLSKGRPKSK